MNELTIANTPIRKDAEGRYCLNDLHRASGGDNAYQPSNWLRSQQAIDLIEFLKSEESNPIESKQGLGTFVVKELVYAYAMWISAVFQLKVIRAYDSLITNPHKNRALPQEEAARLIQAELRIGKLLGAPLHIVQIEAVKLAREKTGVDCSFYLTVTPAQNDIKPSEKMLEPTELGRQIGKSAQWVNRQLENMGYQRKITDGWEATDLGKSLCRENSWINNTKHGIVKRGYNLIWYVSVLEILKERI